MSGQEINNDYRTVFEKIIRGHRKYNFYVIIRHSLRFLTVSLIALSAFLLVNLLFNVTSIVRGIFSALFVGWFIFFSIRYIYPSLKEIFIPSQHGLFDTSSRMGQKDPNIQDAILNYLQIYHEKGSIASTVLKNMALEQLYQKFAHTIFNESGQLNKILPVARFMLIPLLVLMFMFISLPNQSVLGLKKIFIPWQNFEEPFPVKLYNTSGNLKVLKNDAVNLSVYSEGVLPDKMYLVIEEEEKLNSQVNDKSINKIELAINPVGNYKYTVPHVNSSFSYYFMAKLDRSRFRDRHAETPPARVEMQARPLVRELRAKIIPPSYTGLSPVMLSPNDGEIFALPGSKVQINIESDKQLSIARLMFADSSVLPLQIAGHTAKGSFNLTKSNKYAIHIFDTDSVSNDEPIQYGIYLLQDEYPYAEIKQPGADVDLQNNLSFPLITEIKDDYGFSRLWLKGTVFRKGSSGDSAEFEMKLPFAILEKGRAMSEILWDLIPFYLIPDDYIQYYVEVKDNDRISGPKSFRTPSYVVRLPSLLDILTENSERQEEQLQNVEDLVQSSHEIQEKLEEINRELKKKEELSWEQQQELKKQLARQNDIAEKLSEIEKNLENIVNEMDNQQVLSAETLQKYMELQKMARELITPEFLEAMEKLQNAMAKADINQIQKALENLQFSAEQFEKNIERFHELFKRARLEQQMDELVKLAELLSDEQAKINEELNSGDTSGIPYERLKEMENSIAENAEYLAEKMNLTQAEYQELMEEISQSLQEAQAYMDEQQVKQSIQKMQQQLSNQQQKSSSQTGQELERNFDMLQSMLQMAQQQLLEQQMNQVADAIQKAMQDVLSASFEQESLADRSQNLSSASPQINEIARQQSSLLTNTAQIINQMIEISNQTFFLSPGLNQQMAQAYSNMNQAIQQLENRNPKQAAANQKQAMSNFNAVLQSLQSSMSQMSESGSPSGLESLMEQLQKMSGQQGQLNQESMALFQSGQGKMQLSPDAMARLAAQQQMIRNSLEQMSEGTGSRRDILGRLDELGSEMDEVIKELKARKMDRRVIERQERILSRLLDAQKSIREKEYSRKREAERETVHIVKSPPDLRWELLQQEDHLRRELMNALEEGYSQEYKEYIKNYFEILSRRKIKNP